MTDYPLYRCCEHCERNRDGACIDAPDGNDTHVIGCTYSADEWCAVGHEIAETMPRDDS